MTNTIIEKKPAATELEMLKEENARLRRELDRSRADRARLKDCIVKMQMEKFGLVDEKGLVTA